MEISAIAINRCNRVGFVEIGEKRFVAISVFGAHRAGGLRACPSQNPIA